MKGQPFAVEILPAATAGVDLGKDMLEIGPGPGAATAWLRERVARLTVLESDESAAAHICSARTISSSTRRACICAASAVM